MDSEIADRLLEVVNNLENGSKTSFSKATDKSLSTLNTYFYNRSKPGYDVIYAIAKAYPQLSIDWLITGRGEMLQSANAPKRELITRSEFEELKERITRLED